MCIRDRLDDAGKLSSKYGDNLRIYPGSIELRNSRMCALKSRAVCAVGVGESIEEAREISLEATAAIRGGGLWNRTDIASKEHIEKSIKHMERLRHS